jgi:N-acetylglucosamine-6-phosphate deacetylase
MSVTQVLRADAWCPPGSGGPSAPPLGPGWVAIEGDRIVDAGAGAAPRGATDLAGSVLAPGFVDLQCNGLDDVDLSDAPPDAIGELAVRLAARGVTAFCPTTTTRPLAEYTGWLDRLGIARGLAAAGDRPGAAVLGAHLEGPFLGDAPGAHPVSLIRPADVEWTGDLLAAHEGEVAIVTLAPEADPQLELTTMLAARRITVALGHSRATFTASTEAAAAGATVVTHLFNGMGGLHHREPGLAGAALADDRLTPTVIADLVHVHPAVLGVVFAAKPSVTLVSDAVATCDAGKPAGAGARAVGGAARLPDGTLAGATVTLDAAVANVVRLGIPIARAVAMASAIPAALIGATDRGCLTVGARADVVALDPRDASVRAVWVGGRRVDAANR